MSLVEELDFPQKRQAIYKQNQYKARQHLLSSLDIPNAAGALQISHHSVRVRNI